VKKWTASDWEMAVCVALIAISILGMLAIIVWRGH
jgi:hypothetical protein